MKQTTIDMIKEKIVELADEMQDAEYPVIYEETIIFLHKIIQEDNRK